MANFDHYRIKTPELISIKLGISDYALETTHQTKFGENPFTVGFWAFGKWVKYNTFVFIFSEIRANGQTPQRILTRDRSKDVVSATICFWGVKIIYINIKPILCPRNAKFWQKKWT